MHNLRKFILLLGVLLPLVFPSAAGATPPTGVVIHAHYVFSTDPPTVTFTAMAPLCPVGTATGEAKAFGGAFAGGHTTRFTVNGIMHFTCADGSGTFDIADHPRGDVTALQVTAHWDILSGTGAYSRLHGTGTWIWTWTDLSQVEAFETYTGRIHFD